MLSQDACPSVTLSATRRYSVKMAKHINLFSPSVATTPDPDFKVTPFFDAEYLRNDTRYIHRYNGILTVTYTRPTQGGHFK